MRRRIPRGGAGATAVALIALFGSATTEAEVSQKGSLRVSFAGKLRPTKLPRHDLVPISVSLSGQVTTTDRSRPPQLRTIALAINRNGRIETRGLPRCRLAQIQPATTDEALRNCGRALIGKGRFLANVALPEQSPFPSNGKVLAFNGARGGKPVVFVHIYGTEPLPTSYVLPFEIERRSRGAFGTRLVAQLPRIAADWGFISGVSLTLRREFLYRGRPRSYLSAGCPAPPGFLGATFSFARATFAFEDGRTISSTLSRRCRVRR